MVTVLETDVRCLFPAFVSRPGTIFFDNAATTQKPARVVETMVRFYESECANAGRGVSGLSTRARAGIERVRGAVAELLGADAADIAFTGGATDSLNLVALSWGLHNLNDGDEIMLCLDDHRSATLPWLNVVQTLKQFGKHVKVVPFSIHEVGDYDLKSVRSGVSERTRVLAMTHVHHVYGLEMEVQAVRDIVGDAVVISLDASQSIGHTAVKVSELPVDFISFSGHKMFGPTGVGALWARRNRQREMKPVRIGGGTQCVISEGDGDALEVSFSGTFAEICEAGTYDTPAILGLGEAVSFIQSIGVEHIEAHVSSLTKYLYDQLVGMPGIEFAPGPGICGCPGGYGILAFRFQQAESADVAFLLDSENIMVRSGNLCKGRNAEADDFLRISLHVYNSRDEIDRLIEVLQSEL